jgi:hypothetical protein
MLPVVTFLLYQEIPFLQRVDCIVVVGPRSTDFKFYFKKSLRLFQKLNTDV